MNINSKQLATSIVRVAAAGNMLIHGISRTATGGVSGFDEYLTSLGFPPYAAFIITAFELIAAVLIIINRWTSILSIFFCIELIMGIILVHGPEGWFVVGHGRNGSEYSVLLILCFISSIIAYWPKKEGQK
ncbi:MAG: DoxX family protein [Cyclobacteriaceae bacterium]|nr:MAG: DoxX family protein [Cyclobacteriaceae bacterium]